MDLKRWRTRTWTITDEDGGTATVRHQPLSLPWRFRISEWSQEEKQRQRPEDPAESVVWAKRVTAERAAFFRDLLDDLVVDVDGLNSGGRPLTREEAVDAFSEMDGLLGQFLEHLNEGAEVSAEQGKD
jgi:hypothetical protein